MEEKLLKIINHYGVMPQLKYIHSEYFELDEAIISYENDPEVRDEETEENYKRNIAEELADVMVMLKQLQYYYEISDKQIEDIMNFKIDRQLKRIKEENE